ncbi:hypothetical protein G6F36_016109 [Rhizopus arrhizus]|nr:hypothetical protein G6F36_016109 [Rhizopus arrhizus]
MLSTIYGKKSASISKSQIHYIIQKLKFRSLIVAEVNQAQRQSLGKRMHEEENNYQGELEEDGGSNSRDIEARKT